MIKNFFRIAWRNIWKTKGYSFLNIFGLALGIACAALIFLWVESELTYDDYFANKDQLHAVYSKQSYDGHTYCFPSTPGPLSDALKGDFPEIKAASRSSWDIEKLFSYSDKKLRETGRFVEPDFLNMFSLKFLEGNPAAALKGINALVLTESFAKRLFGNEPALGQLVTLDNDASFTVTGVIEDLPENVTYDFSWLAPFAGYENQNTWLEYWGNNGLLTFVQLNEGVDLTAFNKKIQNYIPEKSGIPSLISHSFLYPMSRWHLYGSFDAQGNEQDGSVKFVRLFSIIAWVILLIACINFMNLSTARSEKRAKEVGIRKVVGAQKHLLRLQFIFEAILMAGLAAVLSLVMVWIGIGSFNQLMEKQLSLGLDQPGHWLALLMLVIFAGLLAGSYPAFYLSSFNPIGVMKTGGQKHGSAGWIRKILVVIQFSASIILIICTIIVYQQIQHVKGRDMGYQRQHVLTTSFQGALLDHYELIREKLEASAAVEQVGLTNMSVLGIHSNTGSIGWEGKDPNKEVLISLLNVDAGYIPTLEMDMVSGRNFRQGMLGDSSSVIINESFARLIEPQGDVVGKTLERDGLKTIIGVVRDFVYNDMYGPAEPLLIYPISQQTPGILYLRLAENVPLEEAIASVAAIFKQQNPAFPFEYKFLDTQFNQQFQTENRIQKLVSVFGVLSIVISCLGLFGLASYTAEQRTKEIGVRKVLGASVPSLANLLSREFILLVLISCGIAFPVAWSVMSKWLVKYDYHISVHAWVFLVAGIGALTVALLTVSTQAIRAAMANPVDSLRDE